MRRSKWGIGLVGLIALCFLTSADLLAASGPRVTIRISSGSGAGSPPDRASQMFREALERKMPGRFEIKLFMGGSLLTQQEQMEGLALGTLEMAAAVSEVPGLDPKLGFLELPWMFENPRHAERVFTSSIRDEMFGLIAKKRMRALAIWWQDYRQIGVTRVLVRKPADMKGLKIRIAKNPERIDTFVTLGAVPTAVEAKEVYTALTQGVIDGAEASTHVFVGFKWDEAVKYIILLNYSAAPQFLLVSSAWWEKQPPEAQKAMQEAAAEVSPKTFSLANAWVDGYVAGLSKKPQIVRLTDSEAREFRKATQPVWDKYRKKFGTAWLDLLERTRQER